MVISVSLLAQARKVIVILALLATMFFVFSLFRFKPWENSAIYKDDTNKNIDVTAFDWTDRILTAQDVQFFKSQIDVFSSLTAVSDASNNNVSLSPTGQLPENIKVVAVMRGAVSTVVLEDVAQTRTYFLEEKKAQGDFLLHSVDAERAIIAYQGQTIEVPLKK